MAESTLHGVFIAVEVDPSVRSDSNLAAKLTEVCPVDIFAVSDDGGVAIVAENLDECVLCRLCIEAAPQGSVKIQRLYSGETLV
jgi:NAD-dependent dihydropyrimidine dehydrogenase PreA subunit